MSETVSENRPVVQEPVAPETSSGNSQKIVIEILVLAAAALLAWQFIGCASCYAPLYTGT